MIALLLSSCGGKKKPPAREIVSTPAQMDEKVKELITQSLRYALANSGKIDDSVSLHQPEIINFLYKEQSGGPFWSRQENWLSPADSVFNFISQCKLFGLFPQDYHFALIEQLRSRFINDSLSNGDRKDAALWTRADLMMTDALVQIINDIKLGRLPNDTITLRKDSMLTREFYMEKFRAVVSGNPFKSVITSLEPRHKGYLDLKAGIKKFLDNADFREIIHVVYPNKDSPQFRTNLIARLMEAGYADSSDLAADSLRLSSILKKFQKDRRLTVDGKIGNQTIRELNTSDKEKFIRIAITLDRYKLLPEQMPEKYIWVNIPAFNLKLISDDSIIISSRIVVGKPKTRTPVLNSAVSEMITYPQWTIPQSIIVKEILPALKRNPGYLAKKGYSLLTQKGEEADPFAVDWSKYSKGIPYRIVQGSGDDNALGVLKFNFSNKYAVYLHDTNQRYYFSRADRALSHGCVRVQEWDDMALYLLRNDSLNAKLKKSKNFTPVDSVLHWLAVKEKHVVPVRNKIPLFIRYFTCEGINGRIVFYEDVYSEDKNIQDLYFAGK